MLPGALGEWDVGSEASSGMGPFALQGLVQGRDADGLSQVVVVVKVKAAEGV